jgi:hypothetical protein
VLLLLLQACLLPCVGQHLVPDAVLLLLLLLLPRLLNVAAGLHLRTPLLVLMQAYAPLLVLLLLLLPRHLPCQST